MRHRASDSTETATPHFARADNIERVRRDEEEARIKEEREEGRMMMAVSWIVLSPLPTRVSSTGSNNVAILSRTQRLASTSFVNDPDHPLPRRSVPPG